MCNAFFITCSRTPFFSSVDKIRPDFLLIVRALHTGGIACFDTLQEPRHIPGEGPHRLQALDVLPHILRREAMDLVPVLRGHQRHIEMCIRDSLQSVREMISDGTNGLPEM